MNHLIRPLSPAFIFLLILSVISCGEESDDQNNQNSGTASGQNTTSPAGAYMKLAEEVKADPQAEFSEKDLLKAGQFMNEHVQLEKGKVVLEKLLKDYNNPVGKLLLANNYRESQDYNAALKLYGEVENIDSLRFLALAERARAYIMLSEFDKARNDIEECKSLQPQYFGGFLSDGLLKYAEGDPEEALNLLDIAMSLDPGVSAEAALFSGFILLKSGVSLEAMDKLTRAINNGKFINKGYAFINRGVAQMNLADTIFACRDFDSAYFYMPQESMTYISQFCQGRSTVKGQ